MNKKLLLSISLLLMISFSTGIFVELVTPDDVTLSPDAPDFFSSLWGSIKSDLFTVILAMFFTVTIYLMPCIAIYILCKAFSLGFSSAYLLSMQDQGLGILLAVILPRATLKLPAYVALILLSLQTAKQLTSPRRDMRKIIKDYLVCLLILMTSSLLEVVLLQAAV